MDGIRDWLIQELNRLQWSQRRLARQSSVSQTVISQVLSGDVNPTADFCIKVAQALDQPPERLLRLAGILPPQPASKDNPVISEILDTLHTLTPQQQQEALRYIRYISQQD